MQKRLQTIIAQRGYTSRRKAEDLIKAGKVYVDGKKVDTLGTKVQENAEIIIDGEEIKGEKLEYYLLNKPRGVVSTTSDEKNRKKCGKRKKVLAFSKMIQYNLDS